MSCFPHLLRAGAGTDCDVDTQCSLRRSISRPVRDPRSARSPLPDTPILTALPAAVAMMARPVAGVRNSAVIITLPGSPKGAQENLAALIKLLPHACVQVAGSSSSRALHAGGIKALEKQAGIAGADNTPPPPPPPLPLPSSHHHHHHDHSHDHSHGHDHRTPKPHTANTLGASVTRRHRESPYPLLSVAEATARIIQQTSRTAIVSLPVNAALVGHVLAEDVVAAENVPAYRASIVDGYAVLHTDGKGVYPVTSISHAAPGPATPLRAGEIARITTGAPLPLGATAVVMVEDTILAGTTADGAEEHTVEILASGLHDGENVREVGSDIAAGAVVLRKGTMVSGIGGEIGILASVGRANVNVYRKPTVAVLSTGDEVVAHDRAAPLQLGEIRDSNRPTLLSALAAAGIPTLDCGIAGDRPGALETALRDALAAADVVVTTGGVSMGELDLLKPILEQSLNGTIHFGRVAMKPGKPTTFATVPSGAAHKHVFALPGNPASALVTFHLFVLPALRKMLGADPHELPRVRVVLEEDVRLDSRPEFHRVCVAFGADGRLHAWSTGGQRSSKIASAGGANAVLCLPARDSAGDKRRALGVVPRGENVDAILWGQVGVRGA